MHNPNDSIVSYQTNTSSLLYPPPPHYITSRNTHNHPNAIQTINNKIETPTLSQLCRDLLKSLKFAIFLAVFLGLIMLALSVDVNNKNDPLLGRVLSPIVQTVVDSIKNLIFHPAFYGSFLAVLVVYVLYKIVMLHLDYQKRKKEHKIKNNGMDPQIEYPEIRVETGIPVNRVMYQNPQQHAIYAPSSSFFSNSQNEINSLMDSRSNFTSSSSRYVPGPSAARTLQHNVNNPVIEEVASINGNDTWC